jgi:hypothetical protein
LAEELISIIKNEKPDDIYNNMILGNDVWYFKNVIEPIPEDPSGYYDEFKRYISSSLDIHLNNICIVGSAKTGFSFKTKEFNGFRLEDDGEVKASDIDIAVICDKRFKKFWNILLEMHQSGRYIKDYNNVCSGLFRRFVRTDVIPETYTYAKEWNEITDSMTKDFQVRFGIFHKTSIRLYESWDGLKNYQLGSIKRIQKELLKGE